MTLLRILARAARVEPAAPAAIAAGTRRLLLIHLKDRIGDFLCATPAIGAFRARFPHARIALLAHKIAGEVAGANPDVDEVIVYGQGAGALRRIRNFQPDTAVVLAAASFSLSAAVFALASGARYRIGDDAADYGGEFPSTRGLFHAVAAHPPGTAHQVDRYLSYARLFACPDVERRYRLKLPSHVGADLQVGPPFIAIQPTNTEEDSWPVARWIALGQALREKLHSPIVCVAGPGQEARAHAVRGGITGATVLERQPLMTVAAALARARLFVGHDSGLAHLAAAVGTPAVTLFGLGDPAQWAPIGPNRVVVEAPEKSMDRLPVEPVLSAALSLL